MLEEAVETGNRNVLSVEEVRAGLKGALEMHSEDLAPGETLWDVPVKQVLAADADGSKDAMFLAALMLRGDVDLVVGRGGMKEVMRLGDRMTSRSEDFVSSVSAMFLDTHALRLPRVDVEAWLS